MHYTNSARERIVLPRSWGARGVLDVAHLRASQIEQLKAYFNSKWDNPL